MEGHDRQRYKAWQQMMMMIVILWLHFRQVSFIFLDKHWIFNLLQILHIDILYRLDFNDN